MAIELTMPALSPTMEKGTLAKWLVKPGDAVKPGDILAEIETDKATMEFEAADEGHIGQIIIPDGSEDVAVGTVIATIVGEGETAPQPSPLAVAAAPVEREPAPASAPAAVAEIAPPPPAPRHDPVIDAPRARLAGKVRVSPLAARIAEAKGIDLAGISGTGPGGRIVKADLGLSPMLAPAPAMAAAQPLAPTPAAIAPPPEGVPVEAVKLSSMRKTIARRLTESKQTVPHFYLTARCNIDPLLKLRSELNAGLEARGIKLSVNDMLMKAMAMALCQVPDANVQFGGDVLHRFSRVDISMAVAIEGGLVTPVIRGVDTLSLSAIAQQAKELASKARDGRLTPEDYRGGTCSLSNLGMFGIDEMFPVINPPQALILGTAAGIRQPWNVDGELALATVMAATASFDHRAIDGAVAAQFMAAFRDSLENPLRFVA